MLFEGGLALHKSARMIAVSSNTHKILVYAFALDSDLPILTGNESDFDECNGNGFPVSLGDTFKCSLSESLFECEPGSYANAHSAVPATIDRRKHNVVICLVGFGHETNIPNIAFWNPNSASQQQKIQEDNQQILLASIDIDGTVLIWDVWRALRVFKMSASELNFCDEGGWSIACLDPNFALAAENMKTCYGTELVESHQDNQILDNSACIGSIEDNSTFHPAFLRLSTVPVNPPSGTPQTQPADTSWNSDDAIGVAVGDHGGEEEEHEESDGAMDEEDGETDGEWLLRSLSTCQITPALQPGQIKKLADALF